MMVAQHMQTKSLTDREAVRGGSHSEEIHES